MALSPHVHMAHERAERGIPVSLTVDDRAELKVSMPEIHPSACHARRLHLFVAQTSDQGSGA